MRNLSNLYVDGKVGIGTTSASAKLQIQGTNSSTGGIRIHNSGGNPYAIWSNNDKLFFSQGNGSTTAISITYGGNVGIGTESPTSKTHVYYGGGTTNGLHVQSSANRGKIAVSDNDTAAYMIAEDSLASFGRQDALSSNNLNITNGGNVLIGTTTDNGSKLQIQDAGADLLDLTRTGVGTYRFAISSNDRFSIYDVGASSERLSVDSSGNVGIGTTAPIAKLDVVGTESNFVARFSNSTTTGYAPGSIILESGQSASRGQGIYHYNIQADESWFTGVPYNVDSKKWIVANKADTTFNPDVAQLSYALMTIDSDTGNVGIGTTSPSQKLTVANGGIGFSGTGLNATDKKLYSPADGDLEWMTHSAAGVHGFAVSHQGTKAVYLNVSGNSYLNGGNVGIGTTSPAVDLHVADDVRIDDQLYVRSISSQYFSSSNNLGLIYGDAANFTVSSNATERMRITSGGNVLIGTTTDAGYKLYVNGTARFTGDVTISSSGTPKDLLIYGNSAGEHMQYDGSASALNIYGKAGSPALGVFVNGGAQPTDIQFKVGRDVSQYYGVKVDDTTAYLVHRQDETDASTHGTRFEIWSSSSGEASWSWSKAASDGTSQALKMKLTASSVLTLGGGSNTITDTKVGQWDTAYSWGDHSTQSYATQSYVTTQISNLVDSAPSTLDTLNELAAALGDDPNFATTVTNSIASKVPQTRTLTINGTAYDLSADRSWNIVTGLQATIDAARTTTPLVVGPNTVASIATASYDACRVEYVVKSGLNLRTGTIMAVWDGTSTQFTETTSADLGVTTDVTFTVSINAGNAEVVANSINPGWSVTTVTYGI